jgi:hypothetical protein
MWFKTVDEGPKEPKSRPVLSAANQKSIDAVSLFSTDQGMTGVLAEVLKIIPGPTVCGQHLKQLP